MTTAMADQNAVPLIARKSPALAGDVTVPGDKSISHRSLIFGALAIGETRITGLLESEDVLNTAAALRAMGVPIAREGSTYVVKGVGIGGLTAPDAALDFGNSGTGVRLMFGVIGGNDLKAPCVGDASLSRRPMGRVLRPLRDMGIATEPDDADTLPLTLVGTSQVIPTRYRVPVPSAQVKSAILLAGLHAMGDTTVIEAVETRDHTERMLEAFGAEVVRHTGDDGAIHITVRGRPTLTGQVIAVPGDPSSAAFLAAAAAIVPGSRVTITNLLLNRARVGFYKTLQEMGVSVAFQDARVQGGEEVADVVISAPETLKGVHVPAERAPSMIDEYPVLACVAAYAAGETVMDGLAELRVKESDRLAATAAGLSANGVSNRVEGDRLIVTGGQGVPGGGTVATHLDHRLAMAFLTLGLQADAPVVIDDGRVIATSFPQFVDLMRAIGAEIAPAEIGTQA